MSVLDLHESGQHGALLSESCQCVAVPALLKANVNEVGMFLLLKQSLAHSVAVEDDFFVPCAAGHATGGRTNDLLLLELSGWTWNQPVTNGTAPSPRSNSAITVANGHYLVIHGGRNNFVLDDVHLMDLLTRSWMDVSQFHCWWASALWTFGTSYA